MWDIVQTFDLTGFIKEATSPETWKLHQKNLMEEVMSKKLKISICCASAIAMSTLLGCSSMKAPATAEMAVSKSAVDSAAGEGATEFAPIEMNSAREKLALANKAMDARDYKLAADLATQAQADARLAQGKAKSAKAQKAADALQEDIRVLWEELQRANRQAQ